METVNFFAPPPLFRRSGVTRLILVLAPDLVIHAHPHIPIDPRMFSGYWNVWCPRFSVFAPFRPFVPGVLFISQTLCDLRAPCVRLPLGFLNFSSARNS